MKPPSSLQTVLKDTSSRQTVFDSRQAALESETSTSAGASIPCNSGSSSQAEQEQRVLIAFEGRPAGHIQTKEDMDAPTNRPTTLTLVGSSSPHLQVSQFG